MKKTNLILLTLTALILAVTIQSCKNDLVEKAEPDQSNTNLSTNQGITELTAQEAVVSILPETDKIEKQRKDNALATRSGCYSVTKLVDGRYQFSVTNSEIKYWIFYNRATRAQYIFSSPVSSPRLSLITITFGGTATQVYDVTPCTDRTYYASCNCYTYSSNCADVFTYNPDPAISGNYRIRNNNSGKYVAVTSGASDNGARIIQYDNIGQLDAEWDFIPEEDGTFRIRNVNSGRFLGILRGSLSNGVNSTQWQDDNQEDIYWRLIKLEPNNYKIQNAKSNLYLTVFNGSRENFATVGQWNDIGQSELKWRLELASPFETKELRSFSAFTDCGFIGIRIDIYEGHYPILPSEVPNNDISAIRSNNLKITLYDNTNFKGDCLVLPYGISMSCLPNNGFNNRTSSLIAARR
jgi:hypothetical protein